MTRLDELALADYQLPQAALDELLSPALVVYLDKVQRNLDILLAAANGDADRLRPHLKTSKIPRVWAEIVRRGVHHFKCATVREAEHMLAVLKRDAPGQGDLLVAYPHVGPALGRLGALAAQHPETRLSVLCEDPALVANIPAALGIFVDVNPGMHRTGVPLAERATIRALVEAAGARFRGLHHYEGHLHSGALEERRQRAFALYADLMALTQELEQAGHRVDEIVTSGTPSFESGLAYGPFQSLSQTRHRVSPGTVVYFDARYAENLPELDFVPAAVVLSRVVSHPAAGIVTVDAGSKALAAEAGDPCAAVIGYPHLRAQQPSEEHLPLAVGTGPRPARGTALLLVPRHVCPTVNLAETAVLVDGGDIVGMAPVSARAH